MRTPDRKLSRTERDSLELALSFNELDTAVKQANKKSACGIDGLSTKFINKFWAIFRLSVLRFSNFAFEK
jgi:hypothetical protein